LTRHEHKQHREGGLCFMCYNKGQRVFQCPELTGKAPVDTPNKLEGWWQRCSSVELDQLATPSCRLKTLLATQAQDSTSTPP
jgi:hypothetical protein